MSNRSRRSAFNEPGALSDVANEVQLKSTSSSESLVLNDGQNHNDLNAAQIEMDAFKAVAQLKKTKLCSSYQDISINKSLRTPKKSDSVKLRSLSCSSLQSGKVSLKHQYDHVESKVKQYIQQLKTTNKPKRKESPCNSVTPRTAPINTISLEEINVKLSNELKEKNQILQKMEENYQTLLLKYAEAQNRIDELRLGADIKMFKPNTPGEDGARCQAVVAPIVKTESREIKVHSKKQRPISLPLDTNFLEVEKEEIPAVTPTDSEGVSSVITSMSGHSKILNSLEDDGPNDIFLTEEVLRLTEDFKFNKKPADTYNKVKNWQNSLPPLEMIETPENNIYDIPFPNLSENISPSTNYQEINDSNRSKQNVTFSNHDLPNQLSQDVMKKYLRTLSLPSCLSKRNIMSMVYKHNSHHTIDVCLPTESDNRYHFEGQSKSMQINNKFSSSLPSPKSGNFQNNIFIPSLDLDNLTLSEDETTREKTASRSNVYSSSFVATQSPNSFRTDSVDSCKATASQYSEAELKPMFNKSTSITPDRSKDMFLEAVNENFPNCQDQFIQSDPLSLTVKKDKKHFMSPNNICHICGENIFPDLTPGKSASFQSINQEVDVQFPKPTRNSRFPFNRSVSFTSDVSSILCVHDESLNTEFPFYNPFQYKTPKLDQFEIYTNNLKARSQVVLKALTAHMKNS